MIRNICALMLISASPLLCNTDMQDRSEEFFQTLNDGVSCDFYFDGSTNPTKTFASPGTVSLKDRPFSQGAGSINWVDGGVPSASGLSMSASMSKIDKSPAFAQIVAMESVSPLLASATKQIQTWANQINALALHFYFASDGMLSKRERASMLLCQQAMLQNKMAGDLAEAHQKCLIDKDRKEALSKLKETELFLDRFNTAWKTIGDHTAEKNLLMTLGGTIVVKESNIQFYPPLYKDVIEHLYSGKPLAKGYSIQSDKISVDTGPLATSQISEKKRVMSLCLGIREKLLKDKEEFTEEEKELFATAPLPIGHLIVLFTHYKPNGSAPALERIAYLIAYDRVLQKAEEWIFDLQERARALQSIQVSDTEMQAYIRQLEQAHSGIRVMKEDHYRAIEMENRALTKMKQLEEDLRDKEKGS